MSASKLTPEVRSLIITLTEQAVPAEVAAEAAGISRSTFFGWMKRGTQSGRTHKPYRDFRAEVEQARANAEANLVKQIEKAARTTSWKAAAWLLEHRIPERYGKANERGEEGDNGGDETAEADPITQARDELAAKRKTRAA